MESAGRLSGRERQIMEIVYARGRATATHVLDDLSDPPSRASVRTFLRILEDKGHLKHGKEGREFVYEPTRPRQRAGLSALRKLLATFYDGSLERAVAAHLADDGPDISEDELKRLAKLIRQVRQKG